MKTYRLRWRFDFAGKPSKFGVWNLATENPANKACFVDKTGLVRASIEGEDIETFKTVTLFECDGHEYVSCQGEAFVKVSNVLGLSGSQQPRVHLSGVSFLTREEKVTAHCNGQVTRRPLTDKEKSFNFEEHKLGS